MNGLTEHDLSSWSRRALERAYERRERKQASREDFLTGWIEALLSLHSWSSFTEEAEDRAKAAAR